MKPLGGLTPGVCKRKTMERQTENRSANAAGWEHCITAGMKKNWPNIEVGPKPTHQWLQHAIDVLSSHRRTPREAGAKPRSE